MSGCCLSTSLQASSPRPNTAFRCTLPQARCEATCMPDPHSKVPRRYIACSASTLVAPQNLKVSGALPPDMLLNPPFAQKSEVHCLAAHLIHKACIAVSKVGMPYKKNACSGHGLCGQLCPAGAAMDCRDRLVVGAGRESCQPHHRIPGCVTCFHCHSCCMLLPSVISLFMKSVPANELLAVSWVAEFFEYPSG